MARIRPSQSCFSSTTKPIVNIKFVNASDIWYIPYSMGLSDIWYIDNIVWGNTCINAIRGIIRSHIREISRNWLINDLDNINTNITIKILPTGISKIELTNTEKSFFFKWWYSNCKILLIFIETNGTVNTMKICIIAKRPYSLGVKYLVSKN